MRKHGLRVLVFALVLCLSLALVPARKTQAFQAEVEAKGNASISAIVGESITLKQYAQNMQSEVYTITEGSSRVRDNQNGTYTFLSSGTVRIVSKVYDINNKQVASYTWTFAVSYSSPIIIEQPTGVTVLSGEDAMFTVETRQEAEFLSYRWIVSDSANKSVSTYIFPNAEGWTSKTLIIHDVKSWMTGYKFYCIVSLASNPLSQVYTTTAAGAYPVLSVRTHPVESLLTLEGLDYPNAGQMADYEAYLSTDSCKVSSVSYFLNGEQQKEYVPSPGDQVEIRVTLTPADEHSFSGEEYYLLWNGFQNDGVSGSTAKKVFTFSYSIPEQIVESQWNESDYSNESGGEDGPDGPGHEFFEQPVVRIIGGAVLMAGVLGLFVLLILRSKKREEAEE